MLSYSVEIEYDPERPECHDPFELILSAMDIPGKDGKTYYNGVLFFLEYDLRALLGLTGDPVKARIWSDHQVLVTNLALSKAFELDRDTMTMPDFAKSALDNYHHNYHKQSDDEKP